jgi:hypothetical protein
MRRRREGGGQDRGGLDAGEALLTRRDDLGLRVDDLAQASSDETSATAKPRRSKGSKLEADEGSNLNAD